MDSPGTALSRDLVVEVVPAVLVWLRTLQLGHLGTVAQARIQPSPGPLCITQVAVEVEPVLI
jgi:hypothetical protein